MVGFDGIGLPIVNKSHRDGSTAAGQPDGFAVLVCSVFAQQLPAFVVDVDGAACEGWRGAVRRGAAFEGALALGVMQVVDTF